MAFGGFGSGGAATNRPSLFGGTTGGLFGQQTSSAPAGFAFGQPTQSTAGSAFGGFGTTASSASTTFGFNTTTTTSAPAFNFGAPAAATQASAFGAPAGSTGGVFGGGATTNVFSTGAGVRFGATTAPIGFGATTTAATPFGMGLNASGFGASGASTGFGTSGGLFGAKPATTTASLSGLFSAQQPQQQPTAPNSIATLLTAVTSPVLFGDERDSVIAKCNQLQACWGMGRAYTNQQGQSVELMPNNPLSLFKAVGYACKPSCKNEDGLLGLVVSKKLDEVRINQQMFVDALHRILGSKPNLSVCVEGSRALLDESKTELTVFVQDRLASGCTTRISATDVQTYLTQPVNQQQLFAIHVTDIYPKTGMNAEQLKLYLDTPPSGIDPRIWDQAKLDNPDPDRLIPVPMIGFEELRNRLKHQSQQTDLYQSRLDMLATDISTLQHNLTDMIAKLDQYKRTQLLLSHRVLKVLVAQEIHRKQGFAIQPNEEQLRAHLECIAAELNAPTQFKGRLNELMSQLRLQQNQMLSTASRNDINYQLDSNVQLELRQHLKQQQEGIRYLVDIINSDLQDLKVIEQGLSNSGTVVGRR